MIYLLDTHVFIDLAENPNAPSVPRPWAISAVSALEIQRLAMALRISVPLDAKGWFRAATRALKTPVHSVTARIFMTSAALHWPENKDPADRIIVAHVLCHRESMTLVTRDQKILESTTFVIPTLAYC